MKFQMIQPEDSEHIGVVADWYLKEWNLPIESTIGKISKLSAQNHEFQVLLTLDGNPVATGGLYNHVSLLDKKPRLKSYQNWLALVYTQPHHRGKGLGALLCNHIQAYAAELGLKEIYLFTHTAENLYKRLAWQPLERFTLGDKEIVVMKKEL